MNAAIIRRHHSGLPAHPNELDRWRIVRALKKREHYRYVSPKVTAVAGGYLVESPCCSGKINAEGGLVDVALLHHEELRRHGSCSAKITARAFGSGIQPINGLAWRQRF